MPHRDAEGFVRVGYAREVREMDRRAIEDLGVPGRVLMELAGAGAARLVRERAGGRPGKAVVLCGRGNNGGDGYVIARHLADAGWAARCVALGDPAGLGGDAAANHALWVALGGEVRAVEEKVGGRVDHWLGHADVLVDALFGTGLTRPLEGAAAALVEAANRREQALKVAVDVPSGVDADTGRALGEAFRADLTATFAVSKIGLHQEDGARLAGEVRVVDIAIPRQVLDAVGTSWRLATEEAVAAWLPARPRRGHKGTFGHVAVVGGFAGKEGAGVLTALGALRGGAGLVTWTRHGDAPGVARPAEVMTHDLGGGLDDRSDVLVVGPGLGTGADAAAALDLALASGRALVLDADALNLLAARGLAPLPEGAILTPHPAEAARLLGATTAEVQADRPGAAQRLRDATRATVVLKGAGTLVASPGAPGVVVDAAEPALAAGGTGDVLAGLVAALRAQGAPPVRAAAVGAFLHAAAGARVAAARGAAGGLASEVADALPAAAHHLRQGWVA